MESNELVENFEAASICFKIYVVRDRKLGVYRTPVFIQTEKEDYRVGLIRGVISGQIKKELADGAEIYYLGTYTDSTCKFDLLPQPEFIVDLSDYVQD